ncbi:hypothetical protein BD626DRAFT_587971 [Schizophyllum amplum]|uniref:Uncharacterized protein n=1 Tax=Schizophyllum amplum TaxID=97359 RepID=A0A550BSU2_9AGAR|nr:hypothetical protein BD626DRAFT_587971 [Auriculariopsis ampla]
MSRTLGDAGEPRTLVFGAVAWSSAGARRGSGKIEALGLDEYDPGERSTPALVVYYTAINAILILSHRCLSLELTGMRTPRADVVLIGHQSQVSNLPDHFGARPVTEDLSPWTKAGAPTRDDELRGVGNGHLSFLRSHDVVYDRDVVADRLIIFVFALVRSLDPGSFSKRAPRRMKTSRSMCISYS